MNSDNVNVNLDDHTKNKMAELSGRLSLPVSPLSPLRLLADSRKWELDDGGIEQKGVQIYLEPLERCGCHSVCTMRLTGSQKHVHSSLREALSCVIVELCSVKFTTSYDHYFKSLFGNVYFFFLIRYKTHFSIIGHILKPSLRLFSGKFQQWLILHVSYWSILV